LVEFEAAPASRSDVNDRWGSD